jgi:transcriptional regulator with XRE-family HTH domain
MWREKIIETRKANNITIKMMSERTASHIPEETITRILKGKTEFPRIDTVLELGQAVGLSPWQLFEETTSVLGDKNVAIQQDEIERLTAEIEVLKAKNDILETKVSASTAEIALLQRELQHTEQLLALHDLYQNYIKQIIKKEGT